MVASFLPVYSNDIVSKKNKQIKKNMSFYKFYCSVSQILINPEKNTRKTPKNDFFRHRTYLPEDSLRSPRAVVHSARETSEYDTGFLFAKKLSDLAWRGPGAILGELLIKTI